MNDDTDITTPPSEAEVAAALAILNTAAGASKAIARAAGTLRRLAFQRDKLLSQRDTLMAQLEGVTGNKFSFQD